MRTIQLFAAALLGAASVANAYAAEARAMVRIADGAVAYRQALGARFAHLPRDRASGEIVLEVGTEDWAWLQKAGYAPKFDAVLTAQLRSEHAKTIPGYSCYNTVEETDAFIDAQVALHPTTASVIDIGDSWEKTAAGGESGYDIRLLKITNPAVAGSKPKMFVMSGLHARECAPVQVNLKFAEWLLSNYGTDAEATWLVDHNEFHLLLQANPDGRKVAEGGSWQRKNRHPYGNCTGTQIGADLNRNFPFLWNQVPGGSSGNMCAETYRGPAARSEPEASAVDDYVTALFPDARTGTESDLNDPANEDVAAVYIDMHSYGGTILFPWGVTTAPSPNDAAFKAMTRRTTWFNNYDPKQSSTGLYLTDGASDDNVYGKFGVPSFTWELGSAFFESCTNFESDWPGNVAALRYTARILHAPYRRAGGPDVHSVSASPSNVAWGQTFEVTATVTDARFNQSQGAESIHNIQSATAYVDNAPWTPGAVAQPMSAVDGVFDSSTEQVRVVIDSSALSEGSHLIFVEATDPSAVGGRVGATAAAFVNVVMPLFNDGFETQVE